MSLKNLLEKLHNLLREDGITGIDAMRDICYLIGAKGIEQHITDTPTVGKIDLLNPTHYNDPRSLEILPNVPFSKWTQIPENQLFEHIQNVFFGVLSIHPMTRGIYAEKFLTCQKESLLKVMVEAINNFDFAHTNTDVLGDAYEHFLAQLTSGKALGQYFTNRDIVKFIINEMSIDPGSSVYDPCCGTGGFLTEVWKHDNTLNLTGRDISKDTVILGNVNMMMNTATLLNQDGSVIIDKADSLKNQNLDQYDYILTNPPYGLKVKAADLKEAYKTDMATFKALFPHPSTSSVDLFLQCLLKKMGNAMAIVVPFGNELYGKRPAQIKLRKYLLNNYSLDKVVLLPSGIFEYTSIQTAVMFWSRLTSAHTTTVDFYEYTGNGTKNFIKELTYADLETNKFSLNIKEYMRVDSVFNGSIEVKTLGEICEFKRGKYNTNNMDNKGDYDFYNCSIKNPIGKHSDKCEIDGEYLLMIMSGGNGNNKESITNGIGEIFYVNKPAAFVQDVQSLKVKNDTVLTKYLYYILKSFKRDIINMAHYTTNLGHLSIDDVKNIKIPIPSIEKQQQLVAVCDQLSEQAKLYEQIIEQEKSIANGFMRLKLDSLFSEIQMKPLGEICEFLGGKRRATTEIDDNGKYDFITCSITGMKKINEFDFQEPALAINSINGNGKCAIYYSEKYCITSNNIHFKVVKPDIHIIYVYYYLKTNIKLLEEGFNGCNQKKITNDYVKDIKIPVPSLEMQQYIVQEVQNRYKNISVYQKFIVDNNKKIKECIDMVIGANVSESQIDQEDS